MNPPFIMTYALMRGYNILLLKLEIMLTQLGQNLHPWCNLSELILDANDVGNSGLDAVFTHIHHLSKLTWFWISATIGNSCSALVRDCLHAVGKGLSTCCRYGIVYML